MTWQLGGFLIKCSFLPSSFQWNPNCAQVWGAMYSEGVLLEPGSLPFARHYYFRDVHVTQFWPRDLREVSWGLDFDEKSPLPDLGMQLFGDVMPVAAVLQPGREGQHKRLSEELSGA